MAVEDVARLEAADVARSQPARLQPVAARCQQRVPQGSGVALREELETVLAGVAGPRHQAISARDLGRGRAEPLQFSEGERSQRLQDLTRRRSLHREERCLGGRVLDGHSRKPVLDEPFGVFVGVAGIDNDHVIIVTDPVNEDVVQDARVGAK